MKKYWGYLHTAGSVHVKPYFSQLDIDEAHQSPFVKQLFEPFEATGIDEAIKMVNEKVKEK